MGAKVINPYENTKCHAKMRINGAQWGVGGLAPHRKDSPYRGYRSPPRPLGRGGSTVGKGSNLTIGGLLRLLVVGMFGSGICHDYNVRMIWELGN